MTPDDAIDAAQEALSRNGLAFASERYESAARAVLGGDQKQAAFLLKLASNYTQVDDRRQDELAAEAEQFLRALVVMATKSPICFCGERQPPNKMASSAALTGL